MASSSRVCEYRVVRTIPSYELYLLSMDASEANIRWPFFFKKTNDFYYKRGPKGQAVFI